MNFAPPPTLLYPEALDSFQAHRSEIRANLRDTFNRLHSIAEDAEFVDTDVRRAFPDFPVVANQRAGAWYVKPRPTDDAPRAYFKSTDGHIGVHDFNLRRSNLSLLPLIQERQGLVLVDSTRRGKRFPDALSKTVPIWCAVLNRARVLLLPPSAANSDVDPSGWTDDGKLWTLPSAIGRSEHSQMDARINEWAERLTGSSYDLKALLTLRKPLRPIFVSPASVLVVSHKGAFERFLPLVLVSASKLATESDGLERAGGYTYVQGSGDDHEAWSKGLTAPLFWEHEHEILAASRDSIDETIATLVAAAPSLSLSALSLSSAKPIRQTSLLIKFASDATPTLQPSTFHLIVVAAPRPPAPTSDVPPTPRLATVWARTGKSGYPSFFNSIEEPLGRAEQALASGEKVQISVATSEAQGDANDLGVALLLILLVRNFDSDGRAFEAESERPRATKEVVRTRLQWFLEVFPDVNPSRAVLNRVNEYLMALKKRIVV
ncbi:hypothetical protein RQP46_004676 [Phenoliferia psychrophenolica]